MIEIEEKSLRGCTFIDLFAGIGAFRLALESLGATCLYSSEWNKEAAKVYAANFGEIPDGDITRVDERSIPSHDILCAGFPCQAFSISGKRRGFEDARGTLFFDVARIVREKRPKVVFMENVKNFATHDGGRTLAVVDSILEDLGYRLFHRVMNAADYGVPQNRERLFMVALRKDLTLDFSFPEPVKPARHVEDFLMGDDECGIEELYINRADFKAKDVKDDKYSGRPVRLGIVNKGGQGERIYSVKGSAITFSAYGGGVFAKTGGYLINGRLRKLHPIECARLMGFPDGFKLSQKRNQAYKQLGNSVVVNLLQLIGIEIANSLKAEKD